MVTTPGSLLERLRLSPERKAWERFVDLYTPLLFSWTRQMGLEAHEAADLVQDVFTLLVVKLPDFHYDPARSFRAWLKTVVLNRRRNQIRQRWPERASDQVLNELVDPAEVGAFEEEEYRRHLVGRVLELMQAEFQPATWKACWELVVRDRPAQQVATELGLSVNAVYLAKSRILRRLRQELAGLLD